MSRDARRRAGLSRQEFLRRGGVVVAIGMVPGVVAACGGDDEGDGGATSAAAGAATTAAATSQASGTTAAATAAAPQASGTLDFLSWEGYDIPDPMKGFRDRTGVEVKATYIGNHDEIQAKIKGAGGGGGYDITTYYQGYKPLYAELGILQPLDESKLPNLANLFPYFASDTGNFWIDPDGTRTGVPWTWGSIGITYDSAKIDEMQSWYDLLEPSLKGKIAAVDDPQGNLALTCHILGYDPSQLPKDKLQEVSDLFSRFLAQTQGISASYGDMTTKLVSGEAVACYCGWAAQNSFAADAGLTTVKTNVPKEGSYSFCDAYAIPVGADNPDAAYAWMNEALDPTVNARAAEFLVGGVTVEKAVADLNEATAALYPYADLDALLERSPLYNNTPLESDEFVTLKEWTDKYTELKSSAG